MSDCVLTPLADGRGFCHECDPDAKQPIKLHTKRNCPVRPVIVLTRQELIEKDIADDITPDTRQAEEIHKTLAEKCFNGCRNWRRYCRAIPGPPEEQAQRFVEHLLAADCDQFTTKPGGG